MPTPRQMKRADLLGRDAMQEQIGGQRTRAQDPRIDIITDKVLDYLVTTDVSEWEPSMVAFFKDVWKDKKQEPVEPDTSTPVALTSSAELKKRITGDH